MSAGRETSGLFGFSHITGGYAGGQAEYLRVPYADVGSIVVPEGLTDEQVLFLSDIFPTAYQAAEHCDIGLEDTVAIGVWLCGRAGCEVLLDARRQARDRHRQRAERLALAREAGAETIGMSNENVQDTLMEVSHGLGPDSVIEAVGMESHGADTVHQKVFSAIMEHTVSLERPYALNQAILACRPGGNVSMPDVFAGPVGPVALGVLMNKSLTLKTGQTHMVRYMKPLMDRIQKGDINPSFIISHRSTNLEEGPALYEAFRDKKDNCTKVVFKPHG